MLIGMSPYQLVYGTDAIFPTSLGVSAVKLIQEVKSEDNDMTRRINQTIHLQQTREEVYNKALHKQEISRNYLIKGKMPVISALVTKF